MSKNQEKYVYSKYPLIQRLVLFFAGFFNPLIGYAIYYMFKDDKNKEWQIEFIQRGAAFGISFIIISFILGVILAIFELV